MWYGIVHNLCHVSVYSQVTKRSRLSEKVTDADLDELENLITRIIGLPMNSGQSQRLSRLAQRILSTT